jgi:hypothetical protein
MISEVDVLFSGIWAGVDDMLEVTVDVLLVFTVGVGVDDRLKVTVDSFVVPTAGVGVTIYAVDIFSGSCGVVDML